MNYRTSVYLALHIIIVYYKFFRKTHFCCNKKTSLNAAIIPVCMRVAPGAWACLWKIWNSIHFEVYFEIILWIWLTYLESTSQRFRQGREYGRNYACTSSMPSWDLCRRGLMRPTLSVNAILSSNSQEDEAKYGTKEGSIFLPSIYSAWMLPHYYLVGA